MSFPGGHSQEFAGTFVSDSSLRVDLINTHGGESGSSSHNYNIGKDQNLLGIFHTHPYDVSEGGYTGTSLSAGDFYDFSVKRKKLSFVQSGDAQFMLMRTGETVDGLTKDELENSYRQDFRPSRKLGFGVATQNAAAAMAWRLGIAYYQGYGGLLNKFP